MTVEAGGLFAVLLIVAAMVAIFAVAWTIAAAIEALTWDRREQGRRLTDDEVDRILR